MVDWETLAKYPRLAPRDEEREWLNTPPDEIAQIQSDLHGLHVSSPLPPPPPQNAGSGGGGGPSSLGMRAGSPYFAPTLVCPAARAAALRALHAEVDALPSEDKWALAEAARKCPELVGEDHQMAFLWREEYDAKLAARRLASCWQYKRQLFGPEKAHLPLTLCGALRDDMIVLSRGFLNLLPECDRHGRRILFCDVGKYDKAKDTRESVLRSYWYLCHVASEDSAARDRGIVLLTYPKNVSLRNCDPELMRSFSELEMRYLPIRIRSLHLCHPPLMFHLTHPIMKLTLSARMRKRLKVHAGTEEDVLDGLAGYGLTRDRLPRQLGGELRLDPVRWLSDRMVREGLSGWTGSMSPVPAMVTMSLTPAPPPALPPQQPGAVGPQVVGSAGALASGAAAAEGAAQDKEVRPKEVEEAMAARRTVDRQERQDASLNENARRGVSSPSSQVDTCSRNAAGVPSHVSMFQHAEHGATLHHIQPLPVPSSVIPPPIGVAAALPDRGNPTKHNDRRRTSAGGASSVRRGDPRMNSAVQARLANPHISLFDALLAGGFVFPNMVTGGRKDLSDQKTKDADGVSLYQRKNQLNRRLREARKGDKRMAHAAAAKVEDPRNVTLEDALVKGGFEFPLLGRPGLCDRLVRDCDNVSLYSRKTELCNRLASLPEDQRRHVLECSTEEDRGYMNPAKTGVPALSGQDNVDQAIAHALSSTVGAVEPHQVQDQRGARDLGDGDRGGAAEGGTAAPPSLGAPDENSDGAGMKRSNSFMNSILELPGVSELSSSNHGSGAGTNGASVDSIDELIIGTWLWSPDDTAVPGAEGVPSDTTISLC